MIRRVKRALGIEFSAKALARNPSIYLRQWRLPNLHFPELVENALAGRAEVTLVQVGANDGATNDPVGGLLLKQPERFSRALLIEPQGPAFARLSIRYAATPHIHCLRAAIDREAGQRPLYTLDRDAASVRLGRQVSDGVASFDRGHLVWILRTYDPAISDAEIAALISVTSVPVMSLSEAMKHAGLTPPPTIMLIDTEGYDGQIIRMMAEADIWPNLIQYEHKHLQPTERKEVARLLLDHGYHLRADHADVWGWRDD